MLRRVAPALATGLAIFLATLSLLAWQVRSGHDPALLAQRSGHAVLQTRTSGAAAATHPAPLRTAASGRAAGAEGD